MGFAFEAFVLGLAVVSVVRANVRALVDFQVAEPPPVPADVQTCTVIFFERTFANSYGHPEVVHYTPPSNCGTPGSWAAITLNFTVTSNGTQYDRLGVFSFQNTEIWRTSTPEPTRDGIIWTYIKDVTRYIPLFTAPGLFVLELDNIVQDRLDGQYATRLYATFYAASQDHPTAKQSNLIVPITSNKMADIASVPPAFSLDVTLPRNTVEIYAEIYASGNGKEEFWYYNVPDEYLGTLPNGTTYGGGPFREVRLLVDGQVAGIAFPYAVIFTGGINPSVWRPITSYGALDLPTYFLDLTAFAPVFADGLPHNVTLDVISAEADHMLNQNWYISGLLQVITDPSGRPTEGRITSYDVQPYAEAETSASIGATDVNITVKAQHSLRIESIVVSGSGRINYVQLRQDLNYTNIQYYLDNATVQNVAQVSSGTTLSLHNGVPAMVDSFEYPLYINVTSLETTNTSQTVYTTFDHSYNRQVAPAPFILGSTITERQQTAGYFTAATTGNTGNGTSNNTFTYTDTQSNTYNRSVDAAYDAIIYDHQGGSLATSTHSPPMPVYATDSGTSLNVPSVRFPGGRHLETVGQSTITHCQFHVTWPCEK